MPKAKRNAETKIVLAALQLAARHGWARLTLDQIARAAKISVAQVKKSFAEKTDLLPAIVRYIDVETAASAGNPDRDASPRDRLFEVMMARIDVLQEHRRAILDIMDEIRGNPGIGRRLLPALAESMRKMLRLADAAPEGSGESLAVTGLLGIYGLTLCVWRSDNSTDMSKTMAALDRYLRRASSIAEILFRALP